MSADSFLTKDVWKVKCWNLQRHHNSFETVRKISKHQEKTLLNIDNVLLGTFGATECAKKGWERKLHLLSTYLGLIGFSMTFLRNRHHFPSLSMKKSRANHLLMGLNHTAIRWQNWNSDRVCLLLAVLRQVCLSARKHKRTVLALKKFALGVPGWRIP